jgi:hypothetical protein
MPNHACACSQYLHNFVCKNKLISFSSLWKKTIDQNKMLNKDDVELMTISRIADVDVKKSTLIKVVEIKQSIDSKFASLTSAIQELKDQAIAQATFAAAMEKRQRLEWGIANADIYLFECYPGQQSKWILRQVLASFRFGRGCKIDDYSVYAHHHQSPLNRVEGCEIFRRKLGKQVEFLVGMSPRYEQDGEGKYWIFYE